ncbi:hypothetical protein Tsp_04811 [Trichinella spiralis]|uniref:hypothetical protein n=1 Tax=Trichinella spiralis TaxID=6334 RepID=UPI0001EFDFD0|nr:hypothetical protein Tsp_04811 [Trichinella spiralis]
MSASNLVIISFLICTTAIINIHGELDILQYAKQTIYASDLKKPDQNFRKVVSVDSSTAAGEDIVSITIHAKETTCAVSQQVCKKDCVNLNVYLINAHIYRYQ